MTKPEVLVIGDSHSVAMKMGCDALGINAVLVSVGGLHWQGGAVVLGGPHGIKATYGRETRKAIETAAEALGVDNLLDPGVPVIGSFAYHLGRLSFPLKAARYGIYDEGFDFVHKDDKVISRAYAEEMIDEKRGPLLEIAYQMAANTSLIMVKQPKVASNDTDLHRTLDEMISTRMRENGVLTYDHIAAVADPETGWVPEHLLEEDKGHGNADYGRACVQDIIDRGILRL